MPDPETRQRRLGELRLAVKDSVALCSSSALEERPAVSSAGDIDRTAVAFNIFAKLLKTDGIRPALYAVLRNSDFRFIGIFRFKDGKATSCVHVDRADLSVMQADEVSDNATYCSFVRARGEPFVTANAVIDERTVGHPARNVILSYAGIPIVEPDGTFIGTLCHYDVEPRDPEKLNLELLIQVSSALAQSGLVPPYPDLPLASV